MMGKGMYGSMIIETPTKKQQGELRRKYKTKKKRMSKRAVKCKDCKKAQMSSRGTECLCSVSKEFIDPNFVHACSSFARKKTVKKHYPTREEKWARLAAKIKKEEEKRIRIMLEK